MSKLRTTSTIPHMITHDMICRLTTHLACSHGKLTSSGSSMAFLTSIFIKSRNLDCPTRFKSLRSVLHHLPNSMFCMHACMIMHASGFYSNPLRPRPQNNGCNEGSACAIQAGRMDQGGTPNKTRKRMLACF